MADLLAGATLEGTEGLCGIPQRFSNYSTASGGNFPNGISVNIVRSRRLD